MRAVTARDDSTQALSTATLGPFFRKERRVGQERLSVKKIKDLLRLHLVGGVRSRRQLGRAIGCSKTAASDCVRRAEVAGLNAWEAIAELDEGELRGGFTRAPARAVRRLGPCCDRYRIGRRYARSSPDGIIR
jgi:hypothetical protein